MRVLYVVGSCLTKNTSANMSHNCYVQGLLENNCDVDIIMANDSWGQSDQGLPHWEKANYYVYNSISNADKLRLKLKKSKFSQVSLVSNDNIKTEKIKNKVTLKQRGRNLLKRFFYRVFPVDPVYPLEKEWLKNAAKFYNTKQYNLVISNSSPAASHRLVLELINKGNICFDQWIQIWEDPWYFDLYGGHTEAIREEEHYLLSCASKVYYVSPLTLKYQKKYYPDCAEKMHFIPLPAMEYEREISREKNENISFGYFGDYYSKTRNLNPFYEAMCLTDSYGYIYGDSDLKLEENKRLKVRGRVTLDELTKVQGKTDVLVHLCNLSGGQIPGKIYHYSLTNKPILFILDGTSEEKELIFNYFKQFDRYYFCNNDKEDIKMTIYEIKKKRENEEWKKVEAFKPKEVVAAIFKSEGI